MKKIVFLLFKSEFMPENQNIKTVKPESENIEYKEN